MGMSISAKIKDYFYYDETSPTGLRWKVDRFYGKKKNILMIGKGDVCGSFKNTESETPKCVDVTLFGKPYKAHRIIYELIYGEIPKGYVIDHLDQNPWNNVLSNLEAKPKEKNHRNMKKYSRNTSGRSGVSWSVLNKKDLYAFAQVKVFPTTYSKRFSVKKLGLLPAFMKACEWREETLKLLNSEIDAGFTPLHGTVKGEE